MEFLPHKIFQSLLEHWFLEKKKSVSMLVRQKTSTGTLVYRFWSQKMFQENQTYVPSNLSKQFQRVYGLSSFFGTREGKIRFGKIFRTF